MNEFVWKEAFNIGIEEVDEQHRSLLKLLNECEVKAKDVNQKLVFDEDDFNKIQNLINELAAYIDTHFKTEEKLMRSISYPRLEHHQNIHQMLTEQVVNLKESAGNKKKSAIKSISALLKDWYIQHIMDEDKKIGAYMLSHKK